MGNLNRLGNTLLSTIKYLCQVRQLTIFVQHFISLGEECTVLSTKSVHFINLYQVNSTLHKPSMMFRYF